MTDGLVVVGCWLLAVGCWLLVISAIIANAPLCVVRWVALCHFGPSVVLPVTSSLRRVPHLVRPVHSRSKEERRACGVWCET